MFHEPATCASHHQNVSARKARQVQPRSKNRIKRTGIGTPRAHNRIHPIFPSREIDRNTIFIERRFSTIWSVTQEAQRRIVRTLSVERLAECEVGFAPHNAFRLGSDERTLFAGG